MDYIKQLFFKECKIAVYNDIMDDFIHNLVSIVASYKDQSLILKAPTHVYTNDPKAWNEACKNRFYSYLGMKEFYKYNVL